MDSVNPSASVFAASQSATSGPAKSDPSDYETFLLMLTTQLENQDPTNPAEADELAVQLATFSSVEQQTLTNDLLGDLISQTGIDTLAEMSGWVDMEILSEGSVGFAGNPLEIEVTVPDLADKAELVAYNSSGAVVDRLALEKTTKSVTWDGVTRSGDVLPAGNYRFELEASHLGQSLPTDQVAVYRRVSEVRIEDGNVQLIAATGDRVSPSSVLALRRD